MVFYDSSTQEACAERDGCFVDLLLLLNGTGSIFAAGCDRKPKPSTLLLIIIIIINDYVGFYFIPVQRKEKRGNTPGKYWALPMSTTIRRSFCSLILLTIT